MGGAEAYRANGEAPGVEGLDKLYPGACMLVCTGLHALYSQSQLMLRHLL